MGICLGVNVQAQRVCGTVEYTLNHPVDAVSVTQSREEGRDTLQGEIIRIPVIVHVVYNTIAQNISEAQILSQIEVLNQDFNLQNPNASTIPAVFRPLAGRGNIEFCLSGIVRQATTKSSFQMNDEVKFASSGGSNAYNSKQYLNIWVCNIKGRGLGFATAPGTPANIDGLVISYTAFGKMGTAQAPFNLGRTATHELGHWLGLKHIWGDTDCGSDEIDDTPQHRSFNYGCPGFPRVNNCTTQPSGEMFMNFMDFTNDNCMSMFTQGQVNKMRSLFAKGALRNDFLQAASCHYSGPVEGPAPAPVISLPEITSPSVQVRAFPNPVSESFTLDVQHIQGELNGWVELYNLNGKKIWTKKLNSVKSSYNLSNLPAGIYIVHVNTGKDQRRIRLVKI